LHLFQRDGFGVERGEGAVRGDPIRGRLPVSIPKVAQRGAGIERPAQIAQEEPSS